MQKIFVYSCPTSKAYSNLIKNLSTEDKRVRLNDMNLFPNEVKSFVVDLLKATEHTEVHLVTSRYEVEKFLDLLGKNHEIYWVGVDIEGNFTGETTKNYLESTSWVDLLYGEIMDEDIKQSLGILEGGQ